MTPEGMEAECDRIESQAQTLLEDEGNGNRSGSRVTAVRRAERPIVLYADGGLIRSNPSPYGGTWAWRSVDRYGMPVAEASGLILPPQAQSLNGMVTNNLSELVAVLYGLEALPLGWSGQVCSDSRLTLNRLFGWKAEYDDWIGISPHWRQRVFAAIQRLGHCDPLHVKGHPTRKDLHRGHKEDGQRVSEHQHWCDLACRAQAQSYCRIHQIRSPRRTR